MSGDWESGNDMLTEVRFWAQVVGDAERTVICHPELESRCKGYVSARGLDHLITVLANRFCPEGQIFVIDGNAVEAAVREGAARIAALGDTVEEFAARLQRLASCGATVAAPDHRHAERPKGP